ncbi:N-terminal cleavage protein [Opitutaceae bacterium TAV5]|nr:N-terminal cleavage protein [Opitutaceae bacterium TAV5]
MLPVPRFAPAFSRFSSRAFTLIELLTVIAIIGILAAIIIPVTGRVRDSARTAQCVSNIRQITQGCLLYAEDNKGMLPPTLGTPKSDGSTSTSAWWWEIYPAYITGSGVFRCPADNTTQSSSYKATFTRNGKTLANGTVSYGSPGENAFKPLGKSLTRLSVPSRTVMFIDYMFNDRRLSETWNADKPHWITDNLAVRSPANNEHPAFPHAGNSKANMAFVDGHVVAMTQPELNAARLASRIFMGSVAPP